MNPHEWMDSTAEHACHLGGPCTKDHKCNQGRCGKPKRQPIDARYLGVMVASTLGFWVVVLWAVLA